jgi:hypothetical protein
LKNPLRCICHAHVDPSNGGLKDIPAEAQRVVLFNQADVLANLDELKKEIPALLQGGFDRVVIGAVTQQPIEFLSPKSRSVQGRNEQLFF